MNLSILYNASENLLNFFPGLFVLGTILVIIYEKYNIKNNEKIFKKYDFFFVITGIVSTIGVLGNFFLPHTKEELMYSVLIPITPINFVSYVLFNVAGILIVFSFLKAIYNIVKNKKICPSQSTLFLFFFAILLGGISMPYYLHSENFLYIGIVFIIGIFFKILKKDKISFAVLLASKFMILSIIGHTLLINPTIISVVLISILSYISIITILKRKGYLKFNDFKWLLYMVFFIILMMFIYYFRYYHELYF